MHSSSIKFAWNPAAHAFAMVAVIAASASIVSMTAAAAVPQQSSSPPPMGATHNVTPVAQAKSGDVRFPCKRVCVKSKSEGNKAAPQCVQWKTIC
jgi:hypothetical protein